MLYTIKIEDKAGNNIESTRYFSTKASANTVVKELQKLFKDHEITVVKKTAKELPPIPIIVDKVTFDDPERENRAMQAVIQILKEEGIPTIKTWLRYKLELVKIPKKDIDKVLNMKSPYWRIEKRQGYNGNLYVLRNSVK